MRLSSEWEQAVKRVNDPALEHSSTQKLGRSSETNKKVPDMGETSSVLARKSGKKVSPERNNQRIQMLPMDQVTR